MERRELLVMMLVALATATVGDRSPYFVPNTGDMSRLEVSEATAVGTPVYQLRAVDPEGGSILYSISGRQLSVDPQTGVVTLREPLDREKQPLLEVVISASDQSDNTASLRRHVAVADVNDNTPLFHGRPYAASVREDAPPGQELPLDIRVTDADLGQNSELTIKCEEEGGRECVGFRAKSVRLADGEYHVTLEVAHPLDHETRSAHVLTLRATDAGDRRLSAAATVAIDVLDVQDQPPEFSNAPYSAAVAENSPTGTSVLEVVARDGDAGDVKRPVRLRIEGDRLDYFRLRPTGNGRADLITSDIPLDREHLLVQQAGGVYTFDVVATEVADGEETDAEAHSQVTVVVTDTDDQLPKFSAAEFNASIWENAAAGSQVPGLALAVTDLDLGTNARYYLRLEDVHGLSNGAADALEIVPLRGEGRTPLLVRIKDQQQLDYEAGVRFLAVDVVASKKPGGEPLATARINLRVLDANDHAPMFQQTSYRYRVKEDARMGYRMDLNSPLVAQDLDSGEFGRIEYILRGFGAEAFSTDVNTGGLRVAAPLDRERQATYSLALEARDGGGRVTQVNVYVELEDVNDNAPQFEKGEYSRVVREGARTFDPQLFVRATDVDGPNQGGGQIKYSLDNESEWSEVFSVDEETGEVRMIREVRAGDAPRGQYELRVRATDLGRPPLHNFTRVLVRVGLAGNQRPTWRGAEQEKIYRADVLETAKAGTIVTQVRAHDPDGPDSLVRYRLAGGGEDNFQLNEETGELRLSLDSRLDLDTGRSKYDVIVVAVDGGPGPLRETATATVQISITDVNNKPPRFLQPQNTTGYISERADVGSAILRVRAVDPDAGSKVRYSLGEVRALDSAGLPVRSTSGYDYHSAFDVVADTGEVRVANPLNHQAAAVLQVQIHAMDVAASKEQIASIDVTVYVQAQEDDIPIFLNEGWTRSRPELRVSVDEERPIGTRILELRARDPITSSPVSRFRVMHSDTDSLTVVPNGEVVLTKRLDYEQLDNKQLTLTIEAIAEDGRSSEAHVIVQVIDQNDNAPTFENEVYESSVLESARHPHIVMVVHATDLDAADTEEEISRGYGIVKYSLGGGGGMFSINPDSGEIHISKGIELDREKQSLIELEVTARDGGDRRTMCVVRVSVLDVNDNAPRWPQTEHTAVVPENAVQGDQVAELRAVDPDEAAGGEIHYELVDEGEAAGLFTLGTTDGRLIVARPLTGKGRTTPYLLTVRAQDGGGLHSDAPLRLYVGDVSANDGVPEFVRPAPDETAHVSENATIGSVVFHVVAVDPDDPRTPSGRLTYTLLDDMTFAIDSTSGLVTTRRALDRERQARYTLVVVAADGGEPTQQASRVLQVLVTDVDDNPPRFPRLTDDPPQLLELDEEVPVGTSVGAIRAADPDEGENAAIDYFITDGNEIGLFKVDVGGVIKTAGRLDREAKPQHLLTLRCYKAGTKKPPRKPYNRLDPAELQVLVKLRDIDDNAPEFINGNVTVGVRAFTAADTLMTRIEARDADSGAGPLTYTLADGEFKPPVIDGAPDVNVSEVFRLDSSNGELRTSRPLNSYADGVFELHVEAANDDRITNAHVTVHVARDRDLLRWVFARPPTDVRRDLAEFEREVTGALGDSGVRPLVYDARFLARRDGSLDFSSTGACFALIEPEGPAMTVERTLRLLAKRRSELTPIYDARRVTAVERCGGGAADLDAAGVTLRAAATPAQAWLLAVALLVGIAGLVSCCVLCAMHCSYRRRANKHLRLLQDGPRLPPPPQLYPEPLYST